MGWVSPKVYAILMKSEDGKDLAEKIGDMGQKDVDKAVDDFFSGNGKGASFGGDYIDAKAEKEADDQAIKNLEEEENAKDKDSKEVKNWNDAYKQFEEIIDKHFNNENVKKIGQKKVMENINKEVNSLYEKNKNNPYFEEAFKRWNESDEEDEEEYEEDIPNVNEEKDTSQPKPKEEKNNSQNQEKQVELNKLKEKLYYNKLGNTKIYTISAKSSGMWGGMSSPLKEDGQIVFFLNEKDRDDYLKKLNEENKKSYVNNFNSYTKDDDELDNDYFLKQLEKKQYKLK